MWSQRSCCQNTVFPFSFKTPILTSWVPGCFLIHAFTINDAVPCAISPPACTIRDFNINSLNKMCSLAHGDWPTAITAFQVFASSCLCCYPFAHLFIRVLVYLFSSPPSLASHIDRHFNWKLGCGRFPFCGMSSEMSEIGARHLYQVIAWSTYQHQPIHA